MKRSTRRRVTNCIRVDPATRRLAPPTSVKHWWLTTLRAKLIRIGAEVVRHATYLTLQMARVAVPCELFAAILDRIQRLGVPPRLLHCV